MYYLLFILHSEECIASFVLEEIRENKKVMNIIVYMQKASILL